MGEGEVGRERWLHGAIWRVHWGAEEVGARTRGEKILGEKGKGGFIYMDCLLKRRQGCEEGGFGNSGGI